MLPVRVGSLEKIRHNTPPRFKTFRNFQCSLATSNSIAASVNWDINIQLCTSYAYVPYVITYYLLSLVISMSVSTTHLLKRGVQTTVKITLMTTRIKVVCACTVQECRCLVFFKKCILTVCSVVYAW